MLLCFLSLFLAHPRQKRIPRVAGMQTPQSRHFLGCGTHRHRHAEHCSYLLLSEETCERNTSPHLPQAAVKGHWSSHQDRNQFASLLAITSGRWAHGFLRRRASKAHSREQYFVATEYAPDLNLRRVKSFPQFRHLRFRDGLFGVFRDRFRQAAEQHRWPCRLRTKGAPQITQSTASESRRVHRHFDEQYALLLDSDLKVMPHRRHRHS